MENESIEKQIVVFLSDLSKYIDPLKFSINEVIENNNRRMFYDSNGRYKTEWDYLINHDVSQASQDYTKRLSLDFQRIVCNLFSRNFNGEFNQISNSGYDFSVMGKKIEMKCSNNCTLDKTTSQLKFTSFLGNKFQIRKGECHYFLFNSYSCNDVTGYVNSLATVLVKNDIKFTDFYRKSCDSANSNKNSAHLTIKIPSSYTQNVDYWCFNCVAKTKFKKGSNLTWTSFLHQKA